MSVYMDFSAILAIATCITGLISLLDLLFFKKRRQAKRKEKESKLVEYARSFFPVLLVVFVLRAFIVEPFRIPSGSMKPTLFEGDFILVNKYTYGIRLPLFGTKVFQMHTPERGDILVFRFPNNPSIDFIKRVIGIPGDSIRYEKKIIYLNGEPLPQEFIGTVQESSGMGSYDTVKQYKEEILDHPHFIYTQPGRDFPMEEEKVIPPGMYFVMGDNRDNSEDSRAWGFVPEKLILGKAFFVWLSWDKQMKDLRWRRMGSVIE